MPNVAVKKLDGPPRGLVTTGKFHILRPYVQAGSTLCSNIAITPLEYEFKQYTRSLPTQRFEPILEVNMLDQLSISAQAFHAGFSQS